MQKLLLTVIRANQLLKRMQKQGSKHRSILSLLKKSFSKLIFQMFLFSMFLRTVQITSSNYSNCIEWGLYMQIFVYIIICFLFVCLLPCWIWCYYYCYDLFLCLVSVYMHFFMLLCADIFVFILYFLYTIILHM